MPETKVPEAPLRARILAHRGLWENPEEQNSDNALLQALTLGFSVETDLRDHNGRVVISHDPPMDGVGTLASAIKRWTDLPLVESQLLALNVKADGLESLITSPTFPILPTRHFYFDMSFPSLRRYEHANLPVAQRVSEYEVLPTFDAVCGFLWIDAFDSDWFLHDPALIELMMHTTTCLVSPEIHERDPQQAWDWLAQRLDDRFDAYLCTDLPFEALAALG